MVANVDADILTEGLASQSLRLHRIERFSRLDICQIRTPYIAIECPRSRSTDIRVWFPAYGYTPQNRFGYTGKVVLLPAIISICRGKKEYVLSRRGMYLMHRRDPMLWSLGVLLVYRYVFGVG